MDYKALGKRIRELRKEQKLTQEQLAERMGISYTFVGHIERGTRRMSVDTLLALTSALDCSADYLLHIAPVREPDDYIYALQRVASFVDREIENASQNR